MDHPLSPTQRQQQLERVIAAYLEAVDSGAHVDPQQWIARHPELSPDLGEFIADQTNLDQLVAPVRVPISALSNATLRSSGDIDTETGRDQAGSDGNAPPGDLDSAGTPSDIR